MKCEIGGLKEATTWFTSDTHFGHAKIIQYSRRPFSDVDEMDLQLIQRWNALVQPDDTVFHLGDFALKNQGAAASYRARLNGRIHLIWGNHDSEQVRSASFWESSAPYREIVLEGQPIILLHYGMRVWNESSKGAIHFYGHSHSNLPGNSSSIDVGVDFPSWNYAPARLVNIKRVLKTQVLRQPVDHHQ